jgi:zinc transport system substrate-binding protein
MTAQAAVRTVNRMTNNFTQPQIPEAGKWSHRSRSHAVVLLIIAAIWLFASAGCTGEPAQETRDSRITVGVTIPPQEEFVKAVGGDHVDVEVLVPYGASPHTYEPTPVQLAALSDAALYAEVGSGIEFELAWMDGIRSLNPDMVVVDCSRGIDIYEGDPHIWLSLGNAGTMVENIRDGLIEVDPVHEEEYRENTKEYLASLETLDAAIDQQMSAGSRPVILVYHPAWGYFCRDYNLTQIAIEEDGKEPTPQGIERLVEQAKRLNITVIFASPSYGTRNAQVVADEIGGTVVEADPLATDYLANMERVADAFAGGA